MTWPVRMAVTDGSWQATAKQEAAARRFTSAPTPPFQQPAAHSPSDVLFLAPTTPQIVAGLDAYRQRIEQWIDALLPNIKAGVVPTDVDTLADVAEMLAQAAEMLVDLADTQTKREKEANDD